MGQYVLEFPTREAAEAHCTSVTGEVEGSQCVVTQNGAGTFDATVTYPDLPPAPAADA